MKKKISYIFPIFNEEETVDALASVLFPLIEDRPEYNYEIIFINDGSRDASLRKLLTLQGKYPNVTIVDFPRNYGHQMAVTAGVDYATGDAVIIMDSDLQDPPRISFELIEKWEQGYDVVYAQRRSRNDTAFKKVTAFIFYRVLAKVADIDIPRNTGDFRLISRQVADELKKYREHDRFLRGLVSFVGFSQTAVAFDRDERFAGKSGYPLHKMIRFAADGILGFSSAPLKLISRIGYAIAGLSVVGIIYAVSIRLFIPSYVVEGWTFIVTSIFFIGGIQLIMLGVLGSYIGRIYTEVQGRPLYAIRKVYVKK